MLQWKQEVSCGDAINCNLRLYCLSSVQISWAPFKFLKSTIPLCNYLWYVMTWGSVVLCVFCSCSGVEVPDCRIVSSAGTQHSLVDCNGIMIREVEATPIPHGLLYPLSLIREEYVPGYKVPSVLVISCRCTNLIRCKYTHLDKMGIKYSDKSVVEIIFSELSSGIKCVWINRHITVSRPHTRSEISCL